MKERAVQFGQFKTLVGVVSEPDSDRNLPAVILLNAGLIHRIGPNRVYVKLARQLAASGHIVLRMDLSGIGDSQARPDHMPIEKSLIDDILQAMDYLAETHQRQSFFLMGHCAGAFHSFRTACQDERVKGIVMINPDGSEADWVAYDRQRKLTRYSQNYYVKNKLFNLETWKRLFTGQVAIRNALSAMFRNLILGRISSAAFKIKRRLAPPKPTAADSALFTVKAALQKLPELQAQLLLIYSEGSTGLERVQAQAGRMVRQLRASGKLTLEIIPGADHTFTLMDCQAGLMQTIEKWLHG